VWPWPDGTFTRRARLAVAGVALLAVSAGCVKPDPPGVGIQKLAADIVFGVKPPAPDAPPPNLIPGQAGEDYAITFLPPSFPSAARFPDQGGSADSRPARPPSSRLPRPTPLSAPRLACPPAALNAFPAKEAGLTVEGTPAEGQYRWKRQGTQTVANLPGVQIPVTGFEQRLIRNTVRISATEFIFETVQPELGGSVTTISTFKVKTDAVSRGATVPVDPQLPGPPEDVDPPVEVPSPPKPPGSVRAGEPERGISLTKLQRVDAEGNSSELVFAPGVLYLPLPVEPGESFTSVGIDARTGSVLQHQARVLGRERVDACGEIVDGWAVEATQTFSGSASTAPPRTYRYIVAPQLGGFIVSEEFHVTSPNGNTDVVITLGQVRPSPLPAEAQR
jgi:hypothetical protein